MRPMSPVDIIVRAASSVPEAKPKPRRRTGAPRRTRRTARPRTAPRTRSRRLRLVKRAGLGALVLLAVAVLGAGAYEGAPAFQPRVLAAGISHALGLELAEITVAGRGHTEPAALAEALEVRRGTPMLVVDLEAMRARIEALPWVRSAAVTRRLPDGLHVRVVERTPVARWTDKGATHLIDADGTAFAPSDASAFGRLPRIEGEGARKAAASLAGLLADAPALAEKVESARRHGDRRWDIRLTNGLVVMLPDDGAAVAWRRFAELAARHGLLAGDVLAVDLRLPDRVVVRLRRPLGTEAENT